MCLLFSTFKVKKKNSEVMVAKVIKEKDFNINKWNLIQEITKFVFILLFFL